MMMTPLMLEIVLHYVSVSGVQYRGGDFSAPAVREAIGWLSSGAGLLKPSPVAMELPCGPAPPGKLYPTLGWTNFPPHYEITDRGRAYIDFLLKMPLPVSTWTLPEPRS